MARSPPTSTSIHLAVTRAAVRRCQAGGPHEEPSTAFYAESRPDLSKNSRLRAARFSVLLGPHRDKERFVTTPAWGASSIAFANLWGPTGPEVVTAHDALEFAGCGSRRALHKEQAGVLLARVGPEDRADEALEG